MVRSKRVGSVCREKKGSLSREIEGSLSRGQVGSVCAEFPYSSKIADLILRSAIEVESIAKELYFANGGTETDDKIRYDDAIDSLVKKWKLENKYIIISSPNCFLTDIKIFPFKKNERKSGGTKMTYSWNNSYQNIKHNRVKSLKYGSVKYLFEIMAALNVLNLYYTDRRYDLGKDLKGLSLSGLLGSEIFSVPVSPYAGHKGSTYVKHRTFDDCIFYIDMTDESFKRFMPNFLNMNKRLNELVNDHPTIKATQGVPNNLDSGAWQAWVQEKIGGQTFLGLVRKAHSEFPIPNGDNFYEALLNKPNAVIDNKIHLLSSH